MKNVFLDTNILIDYVLNRRDHGDRFFDLFPKDENRKRKSVSAASVSLYLVLKLIAKSFDPLGEF